ncbi:MAG: glycerophosphodiester phosphodiesterase [Anaerolineae bacterium]|nr:glycerophosphodiester phosphodiesterase [Anaerolineae bacterium]
MNQIYHLPHPLVFAHRGASAHAPENTLAAFRMAQEQGAPAIEMDAKLSADGEVVIIHDTSVDRTCNGRGKVKNLTLEELRRLDAGSFFSPYYHSERIPTLTEVLEQFGGRIYLNIELTNYSSPLDHLPEKVAALVTRYALLDWVLFSSFNLLNLVRIRQVLPQAVVAILALPGKRGWLARGALGRLAAPGFLHVFHQDATYKLCQRQHHLKRKVYAWTVNEIAEMRRLLSINVDGIFTDDPQKALEILKV